VPDPGPPRVILARPRRRRRRRRSTPAGPRS